MPAEDKITGYFLILGCRLLSYASGYVHGSFDFPSSCHHRAPIELFSSKGFCFVRQNNFDLVLEFDKNKLCLGKASFGKCRFQPLSETPYVALSAQGNNREVAQDEQVSNSPDSAETQDGGAANMDINDNQDVVAKKDNPLAGSNPTENGKRADEDVCGSLDEWLQNPVPFGVELELPSHWLKSMTSTQYSMLQS